jgi:hypothetical protein
MEWTQTVAKMSLVKQSLSCTERLIRSVSSSDSESWNARQGESFERKVLQMIIGINGKHFRIRYNHELCQIHLKACDEYVR